MKTYAFILFISITAGLWAQPQKAENKTDAQGRKQGYWEKADPKTGKIVYKGTFKDNKPQGLFIYYYPETDSVHTKSDFRQDGKIAYVQIFHLTTGKLQAKGKYVNEEKDSVWNFYDERGGLLSTEGYAKGKKNGGSKIFFPDGKLAEEKAYKDGVPEGPFKMYYEEKLVKAEGKYLNGNYDGLCTWYFPNKTAATQGVYEKGVKKGVWIFKDKDGKITSKEVWVNGKQLKPKEAEEYLKKNKTQQGEPKKEEQPKGKKPAGGKK